ncbi:MAG TPA: hypothetical protein VMI75_11135 [Polyangiaceae bacterium]|nr:hypothetical protein [Polyangiaceae bacterium]
MRRTIVLLVALAACDRRAPPPAPPPATSVAPVASTSAPLAGVPCGALDCRQFESPLEAFAAATGADPLVIALGEAHAPKGATAASAAKRFTQDLLPTLAGRASDLLVELMMPPTGCADAAAEVRKKQEPVTSQHAAADQSEYVQMGDRARALGIVPDLLRPSCADMDAVRDAGDDAIEASLDLIARLSGTQAARLVTRDARSDGDRGKAVIVYGGMLHNDLSPPPERARWSYATKLDDVVSGRLVSIDLVVPEFVTGDATWTELPWVAQYDRARLGGKTTLYRTGDRSFVLVFPVSTP